MRRGTALPYIRNALRRPLARNLNYQGVEEMGRSVGYLAHGEFKRLFVYARGLPEAAYFAHILKRGSVDIFARDLLLERRSERFDAPAHSWSPSLLFNVIIRDEPTSQNRQLQARSGAVSNDNRRVVHPDSG